MWIENFLEFLFIAVVILLLGVCLAAIFLGPSPVLFSILITAILLALVGAILSLVNKK